MVGEHPQLVMRKASIRHRGKSLYMQSPPILEEMTRPNLSLPLYRLMGEVPADTLHASGLSEIDGGNKRVSSLTKLRVLFRGIPHGAAAAMDALSLPA